MFDVLNILIIVRSSFLQIILLSRVTFCKYLRSNMQCTVPKIFGQWLLLKIKQQMPMFTNSLIIICLPKECRSFESFCEFPSKAEHILVAFLLLGKSTLVSLGIKYAHIECRHSFTISICFWYRCSGLG